MSRYRDEDSGSRPERAGNSGQISGELPLVGVIYVVQDRIWIESTPLSGAADYGEFKIHEGGHLAFWDKLRGMGLVPQDSEYDEHQRGRSSYNTRAGEYTLYLDLCILRKKPLVARILEQMHLPAKQTEIGTDEHYVCRRCTAKRAPKPKR